MEPRDFKPRRLWGYCRSSITCKCLALGVLALVVSSLSLPCFSGYDSNKNNLIWFRINSRSSSNGIRKDKFLEVPQIVWGLNNQKIAVARACLTARMLNRTLLMPSLSASLFYKEINQLEPIWFDEVFQFETFNSYCSGFVQLGRYSELLNRTSVVELHKGSGRKWTAERDLNQLRQFSEGWYDEYEVVRVVGKNPFLWHDHWPVKDYAKIFGCLVLVDEIKREADKVISRIMEVGHKTGGKQESSGLQPTQYVAVHMRIEKDWMIHCKKMELRSNTSQICSSKEEIINRVGNIAGLIKPTVVYLAVAESLLEDGKVLDGWKEGLLPFEKTKLGVSGIYDKYPYLIKSAIDYEVCLRANVFVGNSFSTFSSLIALERTQKMIDMGVTTSTSCNVDVRWPSYAYNILGDNGGPQRWMTKMSDTSLRAISYGSNNISC
ncbi:O-fucosyltransferase 23 [Ancistrocladus abbreviatus]